MSNKIRIKSSPIFIPKVTDNTILEMNESFPILLMESNHIEWRPGVHKKMTSAADLLIVDPVTNHLLYSDARKKPNFRKLPYPRDIKPEDLFSSYSDRLEKLIIPSINYQISKKADLLIAPYFYAENTDDMNFSVNLTLLSETIKYLEKKEINTPLIANISLGKEALHRTTILNYIIDLYKDNEEKLFGYSLCINDFNPEKADLDQLNGLSYLVFNLSSKKFLFVKYVGSFGEVLTALGATGISSGLDSGEIFSVKNYEERKAGFGRPSNWTYVSELFDHINDAELTKIGFSCDCPYCSGGLPVSKKDKKLHYLYKKIEAMRDQENKTRIERTDFLIEKLSKAIQKEKYYREKYAVNLNLNFLQNWQRTLEISKSWEHDVAEDSEELEELLKELKSKK